MIITNFKQLEPFRHKSGIYLFTNKKDPSKKYAGKSYQTLYKRIAIQHKNSSGKHYIDYFIKKHGLLESFTIELVHWWDEYVDDLEILALETATIDFYNCLVKEGGYNICLFSNSSTGIKKTEAQKKRISQTLKHNYKNGYINPRLGTHHSEESKQKLSQARKGKTSYFLGKHHSTDAKRKIGLAHIGISPSTETREKIRIANLGKRRSFEEKRKMSERLKKPIKQLNKHNKTIKIWPSIKDAACILGNGNSGGICGCLKNKRKSAYGFKWQYI